MPHTITLFLSIFLLAFTPKSEAQTYNDTLDVVTWNLHEFGGDTSQHHQATNIKNVMNQIGADIYACEEVVNVDSFKWLANNLNGNFGYYYSYYGGGYNVNDTNNAAYPASLKYGFIYRKSMVANVQVRPLMKTSATASNSFYGRFPFLVHCDVKGADNNWSAFHFVIIHAACCPDAGACTRRINGCHELKDTLDTYYPSDRIILLGDFNDDFDTTICTNSTISNYSYMLSDSINYKAVTLPYSRLNIGSVIGYNNMIDHMIVSNEVVPYFVSNSVQIYKSYSWANTSDHHPVKAQFVITNSATSIVPFGLDRVSIFPNPTPTFFTVKFTKPLSGSYKLLNAIGNCVASSSFLNDGFQVSSAGLANGVYVMKIRTNDGERLTKRIVVRH
ncbi:MAG: T9SS type A sorting domain-containing protein [Chitinophagaceae bacterium]